METKTVEALVSVGTPYVGRAPAFETGPPWWSEVEEVTRRLNELLGVRTVVLRLVHADETELGRGGRAVYHVQAMGEPRAGVLDERPTTGGTRSSRRIRSGRPGPRWTDRSGSPSGPSRSSDRSTRCRGS